LPASWRPCDDEERSLVRDQFIAKLQRKKRHLSDSQPRISRRAAGMPPDAFIRKLRTMPRCPTSPRGSRRTRTSARSSTARATEPGSPTFVSVHEDTLLGSERGYGQAKKPEDYLKEFSEFIKSHGATRSRAAHRADAPARAHAKAAPRTGARARPAGFSRRARSTAWREMTNQDIAARIVGYIRQAAIGDPLQPYEQRVDRALQKLLASRRWTTPQRQWLQKIARRPRPTSSSIARRFDDPDLIFKREGGGFARLDRLFGGELQPRSSTLQRYTVWPPAA
jgi:type I restriction enzyme R subunit